MKRIVLLFPLLLAAATLRAPAQGFSVYASPGQRALDTSTTFSVSVTPANGFNASVFLSAYCPTLPAAAITVTPAHLTPPFNNKSVVVSVTVTGAREADTHDLIIEGRNGPDISRDTVSILLSGRHSPWRIFNKNNSPITTLFPQRFALDRERGIAWISDNRILHSFDGMTWTSEQWPYQDSIGVYNVIGLALDSTGGIWGLFEGPRPFMPFIMRKTDSTWTLFSEADSATGLTQDMLRAFHMMAGRSFSSIQADGKGNMWMLGVTSLVRFDGAGWHHYTRHNSAISGGVLSRMLIDRMGNVWLRDNESLLKFDGVYWTKYTHSDFDLLKETWFDPLATDTSNAIWVHTREGMIKFDGTTSIRYTLADGWLGMGKPEFDDQNNPWIATQVLGFARYDGTQWWHYTTSNSGLPDNQIDFINIDRSNMVWIGAKGSLVLLDGNAPPPGTLLSGAPPAFDAAGAFEVAPNPTSGNSTVRLRTAQRGNARLSLNDALGREVAVFLDGMLEQGEQDIPVNTGGLASGTYFLRFSGGDGVVVRPFVVAR